jgi:hypothetical protein
MYFSVKVKNMTKKLESLDISEWLNHYTIEELQKMGQWAPVGIKATTIYNALRLKRKGVNSIELTLPLDILRNPNFKFEGWTNGVFIHFFIVDNNKILLVLDDTLRDKR